MKCKIFSVNAGNCLLALVFHNRDGASNRTRLKAEKCVKMSRAVNGE
jgi:hypothetical protein